MNNGAKGGEAPRKAGARILVIEDDPDMVMGLRDNLQFEGYQVTAAASGEEGLRAALKEEPQVILLDVMLPGIDGFEVCQRLRAKGIKSPILMLTARGQEIDKVRGLELGADDYITKPFGLRELLARIKAALRRFQSEDAPPPPSEVEIGAVRVSFLAGKILRGKRSLPLGHYEAEILRILMAAEGQVVDRARMLSAVWGLDNEPLNRSVDNHIVSLRRKIEEDAARPRHILTVHGFGYKFVP
jgi:two-component system alkaline phosphatase synthesis response regulator PhoP